MYISNRIKLPKSGRYTRISGARTRATMAIRENHPGVCCWHYTVYSAWSECVVGISYSAWSECVAGITVRSRSALLALQCVVRVRCWHYSAWAECVVGITVRGQSGFVCLCASFVRRFVPTQETLIAFFIFQNF